MEHYWKKTIQETLALLGTDAAAGLSREDHSARLVKFGANMLDAAKPKSLLAKFFANINDFMIYVLIAASLISFAVGEIADASIIIAIVIINAILGIIQENKAEKALAELKKLGSPQAKVIRSGHREIVPVADIVPGDLIVIEAGDYIPADLRLIEAINLKIDESMLTGESEAVEKATQPIAKEELPLGDRVNLAYMGSLSTYGRGLGVATGTGMHTQIGRIATLLNAQEQQQTPLQIKLTELGKKLLYVVLLICTVLFVVGVVRGYNALEMFMTAVSLAVAVIPEGLPAIVTIVLSLGVQKLVRKNAIIRKLQAVETLGSTSIICSDKTGTLTQNNMTIEKLYHAGQLYDVAGLPAQGGTLATLIDYGVLCNDSQIDVVAGKRHKIGDPTEIAFLELALKAGREYKQVRQDAPRLAEVPFDSERKMMTTVNKLAGGLLSITKGAPDIIIARCDRWLSPGGEAPLDDAARQAILHANTAMATEALRVLAVACRPLPAVPEHPTAQVLENGLVFVGLVGMIDPSRPEAKAAVAKCVKAGIRPVMITGDHADTAFAIAKQIGIASERSQVMTGAQLDQLDEDELFDVVDRIGVYARVSPEHKMRIVRAWQSRNKIVAMTGDGVNDAPALKTANIGVAMGITGTEVCKGAADMVLNDDNFATIVTAVEEGRHIYGNIKKSIHFLLSCNAGEIVAIALPTLLGMANPLLPTQILWINLITDSFPALALGSEPAEQGLMEKKPRDVRESIFAGGLSWRILYQGLVIGLLTIAAYVYGSGTSHALGATMAFMTLAFTQLVHCLNARHSECSLFSKGFFSNRFLWISIGLSALVQVLLVYIPFTRDIFHLTILDLGQWGIVAALSVVPLLVVEVEKLITSRCRS